jgi:SRSO17 transposase
LAHVRQVRAAGLQIEGVLADAAYGNVHAFRTGVDRMGLRYAVGVASRLTVHVTGARRRHTISQVIKRLPRRAWRRICWGQGTKGPLAARFAALRVRPTPRGPECWLLAERPLTARGERKAYLLNLPASASLRELVRLARGRWPIEQHYREFKDELGLDHFEGRSYRAWNHHAVIAALAFTFLQLARRRGTKPPPTFPHVRNWVREIVATLYVVENPKWLKLALSFLRDPPSILRPRANAP